MFGHDIAKEDTFKMSCTEVWNMLWKKRKLKGKYHPIIQEGNAQKVKKIKWTSGKDTHQKKG